MSKMWQGGALLGAAVAAHQSADEAGSLEEREVVALLRPRTELREEEDEPACVRVRVCVCVCACGCVCACV